MFQWAGNQHDQDKVVGPGAKHKLQGWFICNSCELWSLDQVFGSILHVSKEEKKILELLFVPKWTCYYS